VNSPPPAVVSFRNDQDTRHTLGRHGDRQQPCARASLDLAPLKRPPGERGPILSVLGRILLLVGASEIRDVRKGVANDAEESRGRSGHPVGIDDTDLCRTERG